MDGSESLRAACNRQLERFRLNYARDWPRDEADRDALVRQYVRWFAKRCKNPAEVAAVADQAMQTLRRRPTLAELNEIHAALYPPAPAIVSTVAELTPEERKQRDEFRRDWYAQLEAGAEKRKADFLAAQKKRMAGAARAPLPAGELKPVTAEDFERIRQLRDEAKKPEGE